MPYRFREARLQAGLTTVQLAQKMGLTQAAVSQWESGKKVPGIETISRLADLYGVTVDYLLGRDIGSSNVMMSAEVLDASTLPILHGKPVWDSEHGWGIVNAIQKNVVFMAEQAIPFGELQNLRGLPPAFTVGYHPHGAPVARENLKDYTQLWIEPILPDSFLRDELRGWYKIYSFYVENEYGTRFLFDTYGSKWLAFEQIL